MAFERYFNTRGKRATLSVCRRTIYLSKAALALLGAEPSARIDCYWDRECQILGITLSENGTLMLHKNGSFSASGLLRFMGVTNPERICGVYPVERMDEMIVAHIPIPPGVVEVLARLAAVDKE